jgi:Protein of unknown function (DUF2909)
MIIKVLVVATLLAILSSLASGLYFLVKDAGNSRRVVRALTVRIWLSVVLFVLLLAAYFSGVIVPHGVGQ